MSTPDVSAPGPAVTVPAPVVSVRPVVIAVPGRGDDLQVRVSAPVTGDSLPVVVFSHGFGWSMDAYAPLADYWAARGLVVVQPTHLDSRLLGLAPDDPRVPATWRIRVDDLVRVLDNLGSIEASVPGLSGRADPGRIAVAGHSWGAQTASTLLGARVLDADGKPGDDMSDLRATAGGAAVDHRNRGQPGPVRGGELPVHATGLHRNDHPVTSGRRRPRRLPAVIARAGLVHRRLPDEPGRAAPAHSVRRRALAGGVAGYGVAETTDENPGRVALVQQVTTAYLRTALGADPAAFAAASEAAARDASSARLDTSY